MVVWATLLVPAGLLAQTVSVGTELRRLHNISMLPAYVKGTEVHQTASYDRIGGNNDGFEGTYSFLRKTEDGSLVIFEAEGKGVIERIWTPTPTDDTLDFYFDGSAVPSYSIRFRDLFSGKVYPFVTPVVGAKVGGFYSYLPIPFNNGCKIIFRGPKILFHQIQYRKYTGNEAVKTFHPQFAQQDNEALAKIVDLWTKEAVRVTDLYNSKVSEVATHAVLLPGQTLDLANLKGGGRIVGIELEGADAFEGMDNLVDLKAVWDGESSPAIQAPVANFFGFAFGSKSMKSLLLGVDSANRAYSFIPMPYDAAAKLQLVYRPKQGVNKPVTIKAKVYYTAVKRNSATEGKFYAHWKRAQPALGTPYVFLEGAGRGHYVGTILQSQATTYTHHTEFFEGDDSTVIDGVNAIHGTGSEDYFNGGWYAQPGGWVERLGAPLHGCLDYSLPYSRTGGYRLYLTDKLPFERSIYHSIEHGPVNNNRAVDYISLAMYYADKPVQKTSIPTNSTSAVFIPDTLTFYTGLMKHISYEGALELKNGDATLNENNEGVAKIDVAELPKGTYKLYLNITEGRPGQNELGVQNNKAGTVQWNKLGNPAGLPVGTYVADVTINNPQTPVKIYIKAKGGKLVFNRASFIRQ